MKTTVKRSPKETKVQKTLGQLVFEMEQKQKDEQNQLQTEVKIQTPKYAWH